MQKLIRRRERFLFKNEQGVSLVELMIVIGLISAMILIGGHTLGYTVNRTHVKNCAQGLALNIDMARTYAQREGKRAVIKLPYGTGLQDFDNDGNKEHYIAFLDNDADGVFDAGEEVFVHGTPGDTLCSDTVTVASGTTGAARTMVFSNQGVILNGGAANRNIYLKCHDEVARLEIVSLTGMTRLYLNDNGCGANHICETTDTWTDVK